MKRMAASSVLIVGLRGLGVEIGEHRPLAHPPPASYSSIAQPRTSFSPASSPSPSLTQTLSLSTISAHRSARYLMPCFTSNLVAAYVHSSSSAPRTWASRAQTLPSLVLQGSIRTCPYTTSAAPLGKISLSISSPASRCGLPRSNCAICSSQCFRVSIFPGCRLDGPPARKAARDQRLDARERHLLYLCRDPRPLWVCGNGVSRFRALRWT